MLETGSKIDAGRLLADLAKNRDLRLLEGFPVVLANALTQSEFHFKPNKAGGMLSSSDRRLLRALYEVSCQLFTLYGLEFPNLKMNDMPRSGKFKAALAGGQPLNLEGLKIDSSRLKQTFLRYVVQKDAGHGMADDDKLRRRDEFRQEFLLSLLLTPRQKELINKKLTGNPFTKTEREYFSRVVKKKLQALADPDLHRLAQKVLQV